MSVTYSQVGTLHPQSWMSDDGMSGGSTAPVVLECDRCAALVVEDSTDAHSAWHSVDGIVVG